MSGTAAMAEADAQLELKKRARRRLIGAAVLAITAAVVLPMVMDREPAPVGEDIQIRIPSEEAGGYTSRTLPAVPPAAEPEPPAAPPAAGEREAAAAPAAPPPAIPKPAAEPAGKPAQAAEKTDERKNGAPAPARPKAQPAAPAPPGGERYVVQLGVFASADNARKVQARVRAQGYSVFTEPMEGAGGAKTRVRAGPFASREAAEQARLRLERAGLSGIVAAHP